MVCHVGLHNGIWLSSWQACIGVIERLVKPKTSEHFQFLKVRQVLQHCLWLQRETNQRRVRSNDQIIVQFAFITQLGHAKSPVLVVQIDIKGIKA